ncbi:MAG: diaminopimelate epimerase [Planctomycetota bacterium]|jgi:diaminopimelate epimerase
MAVDFKKYHGLGNDYLVIDPNIQGFELTPELIRLICNRHFGAGADGILWGPFKDGVILKVRIFNPDGSEAEKSGNGLRIFSKYLFEKGYVSSKKFNIETVGGKVDVEIKDELANLIRIGMGRATFISDEIPVKGQRREVINEQLTIGNEDYKVTCLSIGNPHCVIPMEDISDEKTKELGPLVENHDMFPNRINMQLLKVLGRQTIEIRIWERGAGYTLASGSSSCAAAIAAYKLDLVDRKVTVKMPGGDLSIDISQNEEIFMTGPVESVFEGKFHKDFWDEIK